MCLLDHCRGASHSDSYVRLHHLHQPNRAGTTVRSVADLHLLAGERVEPLSDHETVMLGRLLIGYSRRAHVSFPDVEQRPAVLVHDVDGALPGHVAEKVRAILGIFDSEVDE